MTTRAIRSRSWTRRRRRSWCSVAMAVCAAPRPGCSARRSATTRRPALPAWHCARSRVATAPPLPAASWAVTGRRSTPGACCGWTTSPRCPSTPPPPGLQTRSAPNASPRRRPTTTASPTAASTCRRSSTRTSCARPSNAAGLLHPARRGLARRDLPRPGRLGPGGVRRRRRCFQGTRARPERRRPGCPGRLFSSPLAVDHFRPRLRSSASAVGMRPRKAS